MIVRWHDGEWWVFENNEPARPATANEVLAYADVFQYDGLPEAA